MDTEIIFVCIFIILKKWKKNVVQFGMNGKLKVARIRVTNFSYMQRLSLDINKVIENQLRN